MRFLSKTLCFFFCVALHSQHTHKVDSLLRLLEKPSLADTTVIQLYVAVAKAYRPVDLDQYLVYAKKALVGANAIADYDLAFEAMVEKGHSYRLQAKRDSALITFQEAVDLATANTNIGQQVIANRGLLALYQEARYLEDALALCKNNIQLFKGEAPSAQKGRLYYDLGNVYRRMERFADAESAYKEGLQITQKADAVHVAMLTRATMALAQIGLRHFEEAEQNLTISLAYFLSQGQKTNAAANYISLGNLNSVQNKHQAAVPYYHKAGQIFREAGRMANSRDIYQKLFISYSILGEKEAAHLANKQYNTLKDSLANMERHNLVAEWKTKYETEKIKAEKEAARAEITLVKANGRLKNYLLLGLGILLITTVLFYQIYTKKRAAQQQAALVVFELQQAQKQLALEKQFRDSELKALKAQMNPHFIFNALNAIQEYVVMNKKREASTYLQKFATLIRSYLDFSEIGQNSIHDEVESLTAYLELEKLRFEGSFDFEIIVAPEVSQWWEIPAMLIQPFVENAIVHGLLHKKEQRRVAVQFSLKAQDQLGCTITDNGVGRAYAQARKQKGHPSFATRATTNRLQLLNYRNERQIGIKIHDLVDEEGNPSGTQVDLIIPLSKPLS